MLKRGFTLLEILIVIAIIGILSGVVMVFLSGARSSGKDASIKSGLDSLRKEASFYFNDDAGGNGSYGNFSGGTVFDSSTGRFLSCSSAEADLGLNMFDSSQISSIMNKVLSLAPLTPIKRCALSNSGDRWAVKVALNETSQYWCVDYAGQSKKVSTPTFSVVGC